MNNNSAIVMRTERPCRGVTVHQHPGTQDEPRLFIDAVLYRYRTGIPWRDLPEPFGNVKNVHRRFSRWAKKGIWHNLLSLLTEDADEEYILIDSTLVRAHQHSSGAVGRNHAGTALPSRRCEPLRG